MKNGSLTVTDFFKRTKEKKKKQQLFAAFGFTLEYVSFIGLFIGFKVRDFFSSYLL